MVDLSFAIPATLVLAVLSAGRPGVSPRSLCLLAVPWIAVWITKKLFLAALFVVATLLLRLRAGAGGFDGHVCSDRREHLSSSSSSPPRRSQRRRPEPSRRATWRSTRGAPTSRSSAQRKRYVVSRESPDLDRARRHARGLFRASRTASAVRPMSSSSGSRPASCRLHGSSWQSLPCAISAALGVASAWRTMDDFPDFYCAGWASIEGRAPTRTSPSMLRTPGERWKHVSRPALCEQSEIAVPAPQPPFDFLPFMGWRGFRSPRRASFEEFPILVAVALCVAALAAWASPGNSLPQRSLSRPATSSSTPGQIAPVCAARARALRSRARAQTRRARRHPRRFTAIEPTAGVPVIAAALLFVPRARAAVIVTVLVLALCSIALVGVRGFAGYFTAVLPAHAGSELHFPFQYSLTYAAASLGAAPAAARAGRRDVYLASWWSSA